MKLLSDEDIQILRQYAQLSGRRLDKADYLSSPSDLTGQQGLSIVSPSTYVAYPVDSDGVPALTSGTPDTAGEGSCQVYNIVEDEDNTPWLVEVSDVTKLGYNIAPTATGNRWLVLKRTNYGKWVVANNAVEAPQTCPYDDCSNLVFYPGGSAYKNIPSQYKFRWPSSTCCNRPAVGTGSGTDEYTEWVYLDLFHTSPYYHRWRSPEIDCGGVGTGTDDISVFWELAVPVYGFLAEMSTLSLYITSSYISPGVDNPKLVRYRKITAQWAIACANEMKVDLTKGPNDCSSWNCEVCVEPSFLEPTGGCSFCPGTDGSPLQWIVYHDMTIASPAASYPGPHVLSAPMAAVDSDYTSWNMRYPCYASLNLYTAGANVKLSLLDAGANYWERIAASIPCDEPVVLDGTGAVAGESLVVAPVPRSGIY